MLLKKAGDMLCVRYVVVVITKRISEEILTCECLCILLREEVQPCSLLLIPVPSLVVHFCFRKAILEWRVRLANSGPCQQILEVRVIGHLGNTVFWWLVNKSAHGEESEKP